MFRIFKRRKGKQDQAYSILQKLGEVIERKQRKVAGYLNRKTKDYSRKKWTLFLCGFCLLFGGMAVAILLNNITGKRQHGIPKLYPQNIALPSSVFRQGREWDSLQLMEEIYRHRKDSVFQQKNHKHQ